MGPAYNSQTSGTFDSKYSSSNHTVGETSGSLRQMGSLLLSIITCLLGLYVSIFYMEYFLGSFDYLIQHLTLNPDKKLLL